VSNRGRIVFTALLMVVAMSMAVDARAQATRTWVSGVGDDVNPCSRTAPCKTFAGAISKTAMNGEINCLDPGGFGTVTITKSITIDCSVPNGSVLNASVNGVIVNFDSFNAATDLRKTVRLRKLSFNGANTGLVGIRIIGTNSGGSKVFIEDTVIDGNFGGSARGIEDARAGGGTLVVTNTTVRSNSANGIFISPASGSTRIEAVLDNVHVQNNNFGVFIGNGVRASIYRSVLSNNSTGIRAASSVGTADVLLSSCLIASNSSTGISHTSGANVFLADNDIFGNTLGISGATSSFGTNRIVGNGSPGTAPILIGVSSSPSGEQ
jgi:hypothetical protein